MIWCILHSVGQQIYTDLVQANLVHYNSIMNDIPCINVKGILLCIHLRTNNRVNYNREVLL